MKGKNLYTLGEEIANAVSHGAGVVFGIFATIALLFKTIPQADIKMIVSFSIYGTCLILMYLMSTLYHGIMIDGAKKVLRVADHCAIYLMIAGCYVPIAMLSLEGAERIIVLSAIGIMAIAGILFKILTYGKYEKYNKISVILYIAMGWVAVFSIGSIVRATSIEFFFWILAGGLAYSLGTIFYRANKIPYNHAIWHGFVLLGSVLQFVGMWRQYII